ncbi:MAG: HAD family hydrolase [Deinococcales bacterium]
MDRRPRERVALVLFDIDGTLVTAGGAGRRAMLAAGTALYGDAFSVDGVDPSGKLDPAIFAELAGLQPHLDLHVQAHDFQERYLAAMRREVHRLRALPGVHALLARLVREPGVALGVLTGNVRAVAALKLEATGLVRAGEPDPFAVRVCGDEAAERADLVPLARERFLASRPDGARRLHLLLVGDTPRDVEAGRAHGVPVLGVATGHWSAEALLEAGAHRVVPDLRDPAPLLELLSGTLEPSP